MNEACSYDNITARYFRIDDRGINLFRSMRLTRELISRKDPDMAQLRAGTGTNTTDSNERE